jgi:uncharacterized protein (TIGR03437 family)
MDANFTPGPDAFLANGCGSSLGYVKLSSTGDQLFATYLPAGSESDFSGTAQDGLPILRIAGEPFEVVEGQSMGVYTGCLVDAATFGNTDRTSPGSIVTLFGSRMGPSPGVGFQLVDGHVPLTLGGTQVLVNGEPVPILYSSYGQLNVILPYTLLPYTRPAIQVINNGSAGNNMPGPFVQAVGISVFPGAILNEDGTVNSPGNPARKGSRLVLFGTGGGVTNPPSVAGEVTPLSTRALVNPIQVQVPGGPAVNVEYAGAAPGLVSGVTQVNVKLPDAIPDSPGFPRGTVPLQISSGGLSLYPGYVTVAVNP